VDAEERDGKRPSLQDGNQFRKNGAALLFLLLMLRAWLYLNRP